jgi:hypothetical protein
MNPNDPAALAADTEVWGPEKNAAWLQSIQGGDGERKQAAAGASDFTRRKLRESSFVPAIQAPKPIKHSDLTRLQNPTTGVNPEIGVYVCEMEPDSPGARTVPFDAAPDQNSYRGDVYLVYVSKDQTDEMYKLLDELAGYKMDLRQVVTDNMLKDLDNRVDTRYIATVNEITGSTAGVNGLGGYEQYLEYTGGITRANYKYTLAPMYDAELNNGVFLMSRRTAIEIAGWGRDEMGGDTAERIAIDGMNALEQFKLFGVPHIATIKQSLVATNQVYHFAPSNFLGQYVELEAPTVYVKKERDALFFYAQRKYGYSIGNVAAVARSVFLA